ncbi:hypothetical protein C8Q80DRAFT_1329154 [Daedaleopsis nitida]|nr:hypothetical protein C8Q80DRAFT_1329154 [Daedaleopsis nitida]
MKVPKHVMKYARFLFTILRNYVDGMRYIPAPCIIAIMIAAHVQRTSLELLGLKNYMEVVVPRLESGEDYSRRVLKVVGAFVREGSDAASLHRVGIPVWFLQPLTHKLPVWQVVDVVPPSTPLQHIKSPFTVHVRAVAGVERGITLAVSPQLAGRCLAAMPLCEPPDTPDTPDESPAKRPRVEANGVQGQQGRGVSQSSVPSEEPKKKKTHRGRRRGKGKDSEDAALSPVRPMTTYVPSPFTLVSHCWESALQAVSPLPPLSHPALYFYPPPFLLDTICDSAGISACDEQRAHLARRDEKAHRYLHNYARIRSYLRTRLLEPSLSNEPLTVTDWRVVLWGDYRSREHPCNGSNNPAKRSQRKQDSHNEICRLLNRVAGIPSYTPEDTADYDGEQISALTVTSSPSLRYKILWECHEINFRAELLALDAVLMQKPHWWEIHWWAREEAVSAVWGPPSCAVTVVPRSEEDRSFRWAPTAGDPRARESLVALATVVSQWPGCPDAVAQAAMRDATDEEFAGVQELVVQFYVRTFVKTFNRLPILPVPFRKDVV